ncbi:hypothetical protein BKE30_14440 [Alkanindiges hydrocarboniclasticus]|uniref:Uncharacterized protein n=1 Tax=Alkanindiges hydrocarboniclasticus TaxID=1907941 RepID=A0A1S8CRQ8_9GAMM|nr:hypothetical protein [Alkanindiges hydrocarboniclasticus]ONG37409.1 hypothetical protein BKE30_14440 [Alkanindiges hydrocarboniclasticus]
MIIDQTKATVGMFVLVPSIQQYSHVVSNYGIITAIEGAFYLFHYPDALESEKPIRVKKADAIVVDTIEHAVLIIQKDNQLIEEFNELIQIREQQWQEFMAVQPH